MESSQSEPLLSRFMKIWMWIPTPIFFRYMAEKLASYTTEVDTKLNNTHLRMTGKLEKPLSCHKLLSFQALTTISQHSKSFSKPFVILRFLNPYMAAQTSIFRTFLADSGHLKISIAVKKFNRSSTLPSQNRTNLCSNLKKKVVATIFTMMT